MEIIDLSKLEPQETLNHTSKGNQLKWKFDGYSAAIECQNSKQLSFELENAFLSDGIQECS